jgi:hypothetical protein
MLGMEDPSTALVVSIIAAIFAALSAGAAVAAVWQAFHLHPKPFIVPRVRRDEHPDENRPTFYFGVLNHGHASAHDLRLVLRNHTLGGFAKVWDLNELPTAFPVEERVSMLDGTLPKAWKTGMSAAGTPPSGHAVDLLLEFELTWRQAPKMKTIRHAYWEVTVTSDFGVAYRYVEKEEVRKKALREEKTRSKGRPSAVTT